MFYVSDIAIKFRDASEGLIWDKSKSLVTITDTDDNSVETYKYSDIFKLPIGIQSDIKGMPEKDVSEDSDDIINIGYAFESPETFGYDGLFGVITSMSYQNNLLQTDSYIINTLHYQFAIDTAPYVEVKLTKGTNLIIRVARDENLDWIEVFRCMATMVSDDGDYILEYRYKTSETDAVHTLETFNGNLVYDDGWAFSSMLFDDDQTHTMNVLKYKNQCTGEIKSLLYLACRKLQGIKKNRVVDFDTDYAPMLIMDEQCSEQDCKVFEIKKGIYPAETQQLQQREYDEDGKVFDSRQITFYASEDENVAYICFLTSSLAISKVPRYIRLIDATGKYKVLDWLETNTEVEGKSVDTSVNENLFGIDGLKDIEYFTALERLKEEYGIGKADIIASTFNGSIIKDKIFDGSKGYKSVKTLPGSSIPCKAERVNQNYIKFTFGNKYIIGDTGEQVAEKEYPLYIGRYCIGDNKYALGIFVTLGQGYCLGVSLNNLDKAGLIILRSFY